MAILNARRAAGVLALAAAAGACDGLTRPGVFVPADPEQLLVHAVLHAGADSAGVMVSRVGSGERATPVSGALVRLVTPAGPRVLAENRTGGAPCVIEVVLPGIPGDPPVGCYAAEVPGGIVAGAEYRLEVVLATGERVTGRTTVPMPPVPLAPEEGLRVPERESSDASLYSRPMLVRWSAPRPVRVGAWFVRAWPAPPPEQAECAAAAVPVNGDWNTWPPRLGTDSVTLAVNASCLRLPRGNGSFALDSADVALALTAYDSAYHAYARNWEHGLPARDASAGLQGATGVFGGAATATRRIRLIGTTP